MRWRAAAVAALVLGALALGWLRSRGEPAPHLLLVTFDTTRADHLPAYGYRHGETPTLDRLARNGVRYARCYSPAPLTLPAHTSILTGLYPSAHGLHRNGGGVLAAEARTLAEVLRSHGYRTAAIVGAAVLGSEYGLDQGFDLYDDSLPVDPALPVHRYPERDAAAVTDAALAWLDGVGDGSPVFLWTHYFDPHMPYDTPEEPGQKAVLAPYDAEIAYADAELDRLLVRIGEMKQSSRRPAIVVFAGDHGEALWDHGEPTHGYFAYSETLRVPLIVFRDAPGPRGAVVEEPVSLVDVYPSLLDWLGLPQPYALDGTALPAPDAPARAPRPIYFESQLPLLSYGWSPLEGVILGHDKLISAPRPELYHLGRDPGETQNLYGEDAGRVRVLERALQELRGSAGPRWPPAAPPVDAQSQRLLRQLGYLGESASSGAERRRIDPKDRIALHRSIVTAQAESAEGEHRRAFERLVDVLDQDADNPRALFLLLDLVASPELGPEVFAELEARMARPLAPPFDRLLPLQVGMLHADAGRPEPAEAALRRALEADPEDAAVHFHLGRVLVARGDSGKQALAHLSKAQRSDPGNLRYASEFARLADENGDLEAALAASLRALESHPDEPLALNNAAWFQLRAGRDPGLALERARRAAELRPDEAQFHHTLASVLLRLGRAVEARPELRAAVELAGREASAPPWLPAARAELRRLDGP